MSPTAEETVTVMLAAAGITVPDDEKAEFVAAYPAFRASLDALYAVPMSHEEEPQLIFSPFV
ncbi:MAG: hypothetical protein JWN95_1961 [Frankiales bacterium]|jgi:hypothetical protein|nr:hypothetical protein [Frankiales bacterium]